MAWRERDWAKRTDAERRALWGDAQPRASGSHVGIRRAVGWAIAVSALLFAAGQLPRHHPLLPGLHVAWPSAVRHALAPAPASPADVQMSGPKRMPVGSQITAAGSLPSRTSGPLVVQARWPSGGWKVLGSARVEHGGYTVRFRLRRRGVVRVRLALPDGTFARATIRVV